MSFYINCEWLLTAVEKSKSWRRSSAPKPLLQSFALAYTPPSLSEVMEHGSLLDPTKSTFSLTDEDHTLANALRFTLNQDPRVAFCGYSIPHPSENRVNIRVQTTGESARDVLKDACQDLMLMCQQVRSTFDKAVDDFKLSQPVKDMNIK